MKITIEIECDNDAFQPRPEREVARILRGITATSIGAAFPHQCAIACGEEGGGNIKLRDANGNTVGSVTVTP
jgi:hypothetical protein